MVFGARTIDEGEYDEYIGKWVRINHINGQEVYSGKLVSISRGTATLNPHYGQRYTRKGARYSLIAKNEKFSLAVPFGIRETTRESLENLCWLANRDSKKGFNASKREMKEESQEPKDQVASQDSQ